ncbi:hypothetical protein [Pseudoclavibacter sp. Z016]|uniref:hypothetical protein n=1 Tax=Pseudoclavibacter sp. Z016 TaxID=2080581 RepID=UPI0011AFEE53|nr:hypothetical protein [Pseudoclavibacter sp. Z016]
MTGQVLFPRLTPSRRAILRLELEEADSPGDVVFALQALQDAYDDSSAFPATGGRRVTIGELIEFRTRCLEAAERVQTTSEIERGQLFDLAIGRVIYDSTRDSRGQMGHPQVWDFITLVLLRDLASARFEPSRSVRAGRFDGGSRRHVFQRLWKRWQSLGPDLVESGRLTEDDYVALMERKITLERSPVARAAANAIVSSRLTGGQRREYARILMRHLVQISGIVAVGGEDAEHLEVLFAHLDSSAREALRERPSVEFAHAAG